MTIEILRQSIALFAKLFLEVTDYLDKFNKKDPEDQARLDNIQELLNVAGQFDDGLNFLENVALVQDGYLERQGRKIRQQTHKLP